jgi:hypothetical protein
LYLSLYANLGRDLHLGQRKSDIQTEVISE